MFSKIHRLLLLAVVPALWLLSGCSGGGVGGDNVTAGGGIGGSGITVGSVSKFGSVFVNNVEFDTASAVVVVDGAEKGNGDQVVLDSLAIGKVVRVEGPTRADNTGTAERIVYNQDVVGPVDSITDVDVNIRKLVVMGQTVIVNLQTNFQGITLDGLAFGNFVEVSGFADEQGFIQATYIEKKADELPSGSEVQVRGLASGVNGVSQTFNINLLSVDYSRADLSKLEGNAPQDGQFLEIKGQLDLNGVLFADRIEPEDILGVENAEGVEISGIVTAFVSIAEDFRVAGIPVQADDATEYKGILEEDLAAGSFVLVKGTLSNGRLLADTIQSNAPVKIEADIEDAQADSLTLAGLEGLAVAVNDLTKFVGAADESTAITTGDHVLIFGRSFSSGSVTADKLILKRNSGSKIELKGPVAEVTGGVISVLGVRIDTSRIAEDGFSLSGGPPLSRVDFEGSVSAGDSVSLMGSYVDTGVEWQSVELEDSD